MNENDLARLLPVPAERDLPADRKQILQEHLMTELRQADEAQPETKAKAKAKTRTRPAHRRPVLVAGAVLAAAAIAGAVVVGTNAFSTPTARPPVTAAQLLVKIADAAASQQAPAVKDSEFTYIRSEVAYTTYTMSPHHVTSTMAKLHERQVWLPVANLCVTGLLIENGDRTLLSPFPVVHGKVDRNAPKGLVPTFTCPSEGNLGDSTYRLLQSLPTQPDALLAYLKAGQLTGESAILQRGFAAQAGHRP